MIFEDKHKPISREDFKRVQLKREGVKRHPSKTKRNIFSGLLKCSDCDSNLSFHFNQRNPEITYYNCRSNNALNKTCPSTHYVRADFLEEVVLKDIRLMVKYAKDNEEAFAARIMAAVGRNDAESKRALETRLEAYLKRNEQLDYLFTRVYEDQALGIITLERMRKMTTEFDAEQTNLVAKIAGAQKEMTELDKQDASIEHFIELVRKHSQVKRLSKSLLNEFIDFIVIHQSVKVDGRWIQQLDIYYNGIGMIDLSDMEDAPASVVEMQTRRGVVITNGKTQLEKAS